MIKIDTLHIENFRGLKSLTLTLDRKNFTVHGPNGSGKSGIVDAIEFVLTGKISRLTGQGTSGLTVKVHGPHVDKRDDPSTSLVRMAVFVPRLDRTVTIERSPAKQKVYKLDPDEPELRAYFDEIEAHAEMSLSRREIIRYVLAEAGKRSKEIQALLKLDALDQQRSLLKKAANALRKEFAAAQLLADTTRTALASGLGIESMTPETLLVAVNARREVLGQPPIETLTSETNLKQGLGGEQDSGDQPALSQELLTAELERLTLLLGTHGPDLGPAVEQLDALSANPALLESLRRSELFQTGLDLLDEQPHCPLCETDWDLAELTEILTGKLRLAEQAQQIEGSLGQIRAELGGACAALSDALGRAVSAAAQLKVDAGLAERWLADLTQFQQQLGSIATMRAVRDRLAGDWRQAPAGIGEWLAGLQSAAEKMPDSGAASQAREFLIICQDRLEKYHQAKQLHERHAAHHEAAKALVQDYDGAVESVLGELYGEVESNFAQYYRVINQDDESRFQARLSPSAGKLGLDVDFYERGLFPPGAYHSEGHQDGMGLCLYLALMQQVLGSEFHFAVLDDVVMSVDKSHRKEVCNLLKAKFPNTQFVITTHEKAWARQMQSAGLVTRRACVMFRRWSIEHGPMVSESQEIWQEIAADLEDERIPHAASALRRHLEYVAAELSDRFQAQVMFRGDAAYELVELLPAVVSRWKFWLNKAAKSAHSWGNAEQAAEVSSRQQAFKRILDTSNLEQWAINKSIHYNEWASFSKEDFRPVVTAFAKLLDCFRCDACNTWLHLSPQRGKPHAIRCDCAQVNLNLKQK